MGSSSSRATAAPPRTVPTTTPAPTTAPTTVHTSVVDLRASEVNCWINNHEILYLSLAFTSGLLTAVLVVAILYLLRKKYKRSQQHLQEQIPSQTVTEESAKNTQNEVAYSSLVFHQKRTPVAV
ncbi:transmembrane protein C1orf162 homolog [Indicator indicator]|uniref:transmembrane protein C1orf162 homolog n=1 Tax=Indicator indicator TaxID=1002788 RepID=UPI0023DFB26F|nr:transmembrane protein C1orf162 homolog [Indicator indicator]